MTLRLEKLSQAELAGHAPEQLARPEIDRLGSWSGLTAGVALNVRNAIARIRPGIPRNGIFVEHTDDLGHGSSPLAHDYGGDRCPQASQVHGRHLSDYTPEPRLRRTSGRMIDRSRGRPRRQLFSGIHPCNPDSSHHLYLKSTHCFKGG